MNVVGTRVNGMRMGTVMGALCLAVMSVRGADPVTRVPVPPPTDQGAYLPPTYVKPMPVDGAPGQQMQPGQAVQPGQSGQPGQPGVALRPGALPEEPGFVAAYNDHRRPVIMVFLNRTIEGDPLSNDQLQTVMQIEQKQSATGGVKVAEDKSTTGTRTTNMAGAGVMGSVAGNENVAVDHANKSSFESNGPAEFSKTTTLRLAPDKLDEIGASRTDYDMMEASIVDYFDCAGKVKIKDSEAARAKLDREKVLRIENSDPAAIRLLATELQADVLIQIKAVPTNQSSMAAPGQKAVRLVAKATGTTDARNLGTAFVDMPLPMTKTNINIFTRYLSQKLMTKMTEKWAGNPDWDPIEVRIYKAAGIDDSLKIRKMIQGLKGVTSVISRGGTGSTTTSYMTMDVAFAGAPEDLYGELKDTLGQSQGLKAVDLQSNTIDLEVTGPMNLVTTTTKSETKVTTETKTETVEKVEPIRPAATQP